MNPFPVITFYLLLINFFTFLLFGIDKKKAAANRWRIPERSLLLSAALGGAPLALAAMFFFHHKTKTLKFQVLIPCFLIVQIMLLLAFLLITGQNGSV